VKKSKKILIIAAIVLVCLGVGFVVWAFVTDKVRLVVTNSDESVTKKSVVCDDALIKRYNEVITASEDNDVYRDGLKKVAEEVERKGGQQEDANCAYIRYVYYAYIRDASKVRQAFDDLKHVSESGVYLSPDIINPDSIERMRQQVETIESPATSSEEGMG